MPRDEGPPEPSRSFFHEIDKQIHERSSRLAAKLERNYERDRDDVQRLVQAGHLDRDVLIKRYHDELRPYFGRPETHDLTLKLWVEAYWPDPGSGE